MPRATGTPPRAILVHPGSLFGRAEADEKQIGPSALERGEDRRVFGRIVLETERRTIRSADVELRVSSRQSDRRRRGRALASAQQEYPQAPRAAHSQRASNRSVRSRVRAAASRATRRPIGAARRRARREGSVVDFAQQGVALKQNDVIGVRRDDVCRRPAGDGARDDRSDDVVEGENVDVRTGDVGRQPAAGRAPGLFAMRPHVPLRGRHPTDSA